MPLTAASPLVWLGFTLLVLLLLALDLGLLHRRSREIPPGAALLWTLFWIVLALLFNVGVYFWLGPERALEFLTGYLIEKGLSIDNIFVFLVIFSYFRVPAIYQHRVLFWGVLGAIVLRAVFIISGAALLQAFHWIIYVFGGFLILTGIRIIREQHEAMDPEQQPLVRLFLRAFRRVIPMVPDYADGRLLVRRDGRLHATPLLLVLGVVEGTDIVFAIDSIPAIFAVTKDPFIVYTSNIFAILGLRSLYFALAAMVGRFRHLKNGLGIVLIFVGIKMAISDWYEIPIGVSLAVVATVLGGSVLASVFGAPAPTPPHPPHAPAGSEEAAARETPVAPGG